MKTVWYYDFVRNKKQYLRSILFLFLLLFLLFCLSVLLDQAVPVINRQYMKWPDMVKNLLALPPWSSHLYVNIWQIMALCYPVYFMYDTMTELASSIIEEERLETIVYLHNLSISRREVMAAKAIIGTAQSLFRLFLLFIENTVFFLILKADYMVANMAEYCIRLFLVSLLYEVIALFIASYEKSENACSDKVLAIVILPLLLARIHALIQFFVELLTVVNRQGVLTERLAKIAGICRIFSIVSPVTWCWTEVEISALYLQCAILIGLVLLVAADSIYRSRRSKMVDGG